MPQVQPNFFLDTRFTDQDCPKCGGQMALARILPAGIDTERRTSECPTCDHSQSVVVRYKSVR